MIHLRLFENETAFEAAKDSIEKPWVAYTEEEMITHYMPEDAEEPVIMKTVAAWLGGGDADAVLDSTEDYTSASPMEVLSTKKLTSIKFPAQATSIETLDTTDLETVDVSDCDADSAIIEQVKELVSDDTQVIEPEVVPAGPTYEYVDLGLPSGTKWATCNLGASTPTEYGDYYMWGSTTPNNNDDCSWANAPFNNGSSSFDSAYFNEHKSEWLDENNNLKPEYDAVYQATGGAAHMPTEAQYNELAANTTNTWVTDYEGTGVKGRLFTSKTDSSKSIFFPASGNRWGSSVNYQGILVDLWSSSLITDVPIYAWYMYFNSDGCNVGGYYRFYGFCVRGVL